MDMGSPGKRGSIPSRLLKSFGHALAGIVSAVQTERNMQIHLISGAAAIGLSAYFSISKMEWLFILFAIGGMLSLELMNTAVERTVDLVTKDFHPVAKQAKDISAGAVFVFACVSAILGLVIFLPRIIALFGS
ncbi:diacylglycerol kinase family protein [Bacillus sp. FJAT-27445]|uniref:diacylglycerol kinase family protein n=1 Tax=Bacillus sp. FJAT-27445 TaxID=1679166 RepID=UPI0007440B5B|nr:diacylglycerol kinase family protein [Bacillus sp. FJAT-27445]